VAAGTRFEEVSGRSREVGKGWSLKEIGDNGYAKKLGWRAGVQGWTLYYSLCYVSSTMLNFQHTLLFWALAAMPVFAQSFDVASVKPSAPDTQPNANFPLGPGNAYTQNGGYFNATGFPLALYIGFAYKLNGNDGQSMARQLPAWAKEERFDIQARVEGNPTKDEMRMLMRSLLADRFKLGMHNEDREAAVLAFVVGKEGKLGPQLRPRPADETCPTAGVAPGETVEGGFPALCGGLLPMRPSAPGRLSFGGRNVTIAFIANSLSGAMGRPMVDRTGLNGNFDFLLEWMPDVAPPAKPGFEAPIDRSGPSFAEAVREQLGLKLESQKAMLPMWIVDHVERPTGN
jgi:uncharacterized protein (TIGR03435 family)